MSKSDEERARRLSEALRANLRRRKAQARGAPLTDPAERDRDRDRNGDENP